MMKRMIETIFALVVVLVASVSISFGYSKPNTYNEDTQKIVFKEQYLSSPHGWIISKAIDLLRLDGYGQQADIAEKYLLPMLLGVTFNDVWGDADLAGASILDYYVPQAPNDNFGFGAGFLSWDSFSLSPYKNNTASFKSSPFYGYENAAEHAQFRYDYAKRIYRGHHGDDFRDKMAGWVVDTVLGQDDPQDGKYAVGSDQINAQKRFGAGQTPASALLDLLQNHTTHQDVFPEKGSEDENALSTIYVPTQEVFDQAPEWFDEHFGSADDIEAYNGYDGDEHAVYANWTLDAGGECSDGHECAAPMIVRLPRNSKAHAFFQLGWALHLLEDQTTPVHTTNDSLTTFLVHNNTEKRADEVLAGTVRYNNLVVRDQLPALSLSDFQGLYSFPPSGFPPLRAACPGLATDSAQYFKPRWYTETDPATMARISPASQPGEGVAHAYVRDTAEITNTFMPYIECTATGIDRDWNKVGYFTAFGLDLGIKSAAGLIRQFIEEVDRVPPTVTIVQPAATSYPHSATLTLNYSATDDLSRSLKSVTPTLDGATTVAGHGLESGQAINLLTELTLGDHTFTVTAVDTADNSTTKSVTFSINVTPDSIKDDVTRFFSLGLIKNQGLANSLLAKLNAAADARARGHCQTAANDYQAFINELMAQLGKGVDAGAAQIMIADAQYLMAHCP
jgi:hypothetical protein